ncbi:hypothetical protein GW17_00006377 [Ensete ventricosum]|nr:hypothetical protein GW17_00006377 [Ensete ventricosum]
MLRPGVTQEWLDEGELPREQTKNRRWRRPYDVVAGELDCFSAHIRLREPDKSEDKADGAQLPKSKASVRKEVDSEERHSAAEADLPIAKEGMKMQVIDPVLSLRESIGRKRGQGGGEYKGKLQVPRQGGRAEAKELHKTSVDGFLIKIAEIEGLWVDAGVLDQGIK